MFCICIRIVCFSVLFYGYINAWMNAPSFFASLAQKGYVSKYYRKLRDFNETTELY